MKKVLIISVIAIFAIFLTSCGGSTSGKRLTQEQPVTSTEVAEPPVFNSEPSNTPTEVFKKITFTPKDIQVTAPIENNNDLWGESQTPCVSYRAKVIFIDSSNQEYVISLDAFIPKTGSNEEKTASEKEMVKTKKFFNEITNSEHSDWKVECDKERLYLYKVSKITNRKIGKLTVREEEPEPIWDDYYSKKE